MNLAGILNEKNAGLRRKYVHLFHNFDDGNPKSIALLDELRGKLGISAEQIQTDFETIQEVKRLNATHDDAELFELGEVEREAEKVEREHIEKYQKFHAQWKADHGALAMAAANARGRIAHARQSRLDANRRLAELDALRPDLHLPPEHA